jgi:hypothetical protein
MMRIFLSTVAAAVLALPLTTIPVGAADYERETKTEIDRDDDETTIKSETNIKRDGKDMEVERETKIERDDGELKVERKVEVDRDPGFDRSRVYVFD